MPFYADVLTAMVNQIITTTGLTTDQVALSLTLNPPILTVGAPYVLIHPDRALPIPGQVTGVGNFGSAWEYHLRISLIARVATDQAYLDGDKCSALIAQSQAVYSALELVFLYDGNDNLLEQIPMRMTNVSEPELYPTSKDVVVMRQAWTFQGVTPVTRED